MINDKIVIKIDIDGVLRNMVQAVLDIYNNEFNQGQIKTIDQVGDWDFINTITNIQGIDSHKYYLDIRSDEVVLNSEPYIGAVEMIDTLNSEGFYIYLVTDQWFDNKIKTLNWLKNNDFKYHSIAFTKYKYSIRGEILLEDKYENLKDEARFGDAIPICFNQIYNSHYDGKIVYSFKEFIDYCIEYKNSIEFFKKGGL